MTDVTELQRYEQRLVQAREELRAARKAAAAADERLVTAERQAEGLQHVVEGLKLIEQAEREPQKEQLPVGNQGANGSADQPRGREAVRRVMREEPGTAWQQAAIVQTVMLRGWIDPNAKQPEAAIRVAVRRLAEDGELEKVPGMHGAYRYKGSGATAPGEAIRSAGESEAPTLDEGG